MNTNKFKVQVTLNLELDLTDSGITAHAVMERLDNIIADELTDKGDDIITIKRVESE